MADSQPMIYDDGSNIALQTEEEGKAQIVRARNEIWNPNTGTWDPETQASGGGASGGLTDTQLRATPVPVSGSFYPATQPVSAASLPLPTGAAQDGTDGAAAPSIPGTGIRGWLRAIYDKLAGTLTVTVSNLPATQPVSGTFWQTTQPISATSLPLPSGAAQEHSTAASPGSVRLSDGSAYLGSTSGRLDVQVGNFPATQPVSGTVTANTGLTQPLTDTQLRASAVPVSGPLTDTQLRASAVPVSGPLTDTQLRASVLPVRNAPDTGRSQVLLSWEEMAGTAGAESALTNFTLGSRAGAALTAANNLQVTAGKTLRIELVTVYVKATSTVNNVARFRVRQAASVLNSSPVIFDAVLALELGTVAAGALHSESYPFPDGLEVTAGQQITFTWFTAANTCTVGMSIVGFEY